MKDYTNPADSKTPTECRLLKRIPNSSDYEPQVGSSLIMARRSPALCSLLHTYKVYVTGGIQNGISLATTEIYDVRVDSWIPGKSMNVARSSHGSCVTETGTVYVFCGCNHLQGFLNSIEKLSVNGSSWEMIDVPAGSL